MVLRYCVVAVMVVLMVVWVYCDRCVGGDLVVDMIVGEGVD